MLFLLFMTHWIQIYEKLTQPILLEIFWRSFWKKNILSENRFSPIYDVMKVWILLILPKNSFFCSFWPIQTKYMKNWPSLSCCKFSEDYFEKNFFAKKSIFTNLWRHEGVNFADFTKKCVFLLFLTHLTQIYEKFTQPILLQIFWILFWKIIFAKKSIFTNLWRHECVNFVNFNKKIFILLFLTHLNQIYEKLTQPILLQTFWRLFWKNIFCQKIDFH